MKKIAILSTLIELASLAAFAAGADGNLARYGIREVSDDNLLGVNEATYDAAMNDSWDVLLGSEGESKTEVLSTFEFNSVYMGKKIANRAIKAELSDARPLFAGESYMNVSYFDPLESAYAKRVEFIQGWKYNIASSAHLDIGGSFLFTDRDIAADYRYSKNGYGETFGGNIYLGFIGDVKRLQPFAYYIFDFSYNTSEFRFGIAPNYAFDDQSPLKGLSAEFSAYGAYVHVDKFDGTHGNLKENYWYCTLKLSASYKLCEYAVLKASVGYAYNGSDGVSGLPSYDMGPNENVFSSVSAGISF